MNKKNTSVKCFIFVVMSLILLSLSGAFASAGPVKTINSVTLNGASSVNVAPSQKITASVTATAYGGDEDWHSTRYQIGSGSWVCKNTANHNSGTNTESFNITAP